MHFMSQFSSQICTQRLAGYNSHMAKKTTLDDIAKMLTQHGNEIHDLTDTVAHVVKNMATKDQIVALHTQVNSIETQVRGMKHVKLEGRVADLEEKVFGTVRA